jgi:hypothetical protein
VTTPLFGSRTFTAVAIVGRNPPPAEESPLSKEQKLMKAVIAATGDASISDVAEFNPKGSAGATAAGSVAGSLAGGAATGGDGWGRAVGASGGAAAGRALMGLSEDLPPRVCVAISPNEVYLFGMRAMGYHVDPLAKIDRDKLGVEIHQRISVRTVVLEDLETGHKFPLEVKRLNFYHAKAMVELLMMSEAHLEVEVEEEEEPAPSDAG